MDNFSWSDLVLFIFASIGMTLILVEGKIAMRLRKTITEKDWRIKFWIFDIRLKEIISCRQCCGFWVGLFCGALTILPWSLVVNKIFLFGCASSFVSIFGGAILDYYNALVYLEEK